MKCPFCSSDDTQVRDTRSAADGQSIRRRRVCVNCDARFTTIERVQLRELSVVKNNNEREPFDRDKLARSFSLALRKRDVSADKLETAINQLVRRIENTAEREVPASSIGEMVMEALSALDKVAYVRYASVYRNFTEAGDFTAFIRSDEETS